MQGGNNLDRSGMGSSSLDSMLGNGTHLSAARGGIGSASCALAPLTAVAPTSQAMRQLHGLDKHPLLSKPGL